MAAAADLQTPSVMHVPCGPLLLLLPPVLLPPGCAPFVNSLTSTTQHSSPHSPPNTPQAAGHGA